MFEEGIPDKIKTHAKRIIVQFKINIEIDEIESTSQLTRITFKPDLTSKYLDEPIPTQYPPRPINNNDVQLKL